MQNNYFPYGRYVDICCVPQYNIAKVDLNGSGIIHGTRNIAHITIFLYTELKEMRNDTR